MPCVCVHTRLRTHNTGHRPIRGKTSEMFLKAPDTVFLVLRVRRISAFRRTAVWGIFYANYFSGLLFRRAVRTEMFSAARDFVKPFHAGVPAHAAVVHDGRASVRPVPDDLFSAGAVRKETIEFRWSLFWWRIPGSNW